MQKYHDEPKQYKGYLKSALGFAGERTAAKGASRANARRPVPNSTMCVGSPTAGAWSSFQRRPDDEFETDRFGPGVMGVNCHRSL